MIRSRRTPSGGCAALRTLLPLLDVNGDGHVDREELKNVMPGDTDEEIEAILQSMDLDGDGRVTAEEWVEGVLAMHQSQRRSGTPSRGRASLRARAREWPLCMRSPSNVQSFPPLSPLFFYFYHVSHQLGNALPACSKKRRANNTCPSKAKRSSTAQLTCR